MVSLGKRSEANAHHNKIKRMIMDMEQRSSDRDNEKETTK